MSFRLEKANASIQKNLAEILYELNDPRLKDKMVTVTSVSVSPDLKNARVFVSVFGGEDDKLAIEAIQNASGFIRQRLGTRIEYRVLPTLDFRLSKSEELGQNVENILKKLHADEHQK